MVQVFMTILLGYFATQAFTVAQIRTMTDWQKQPTKPLTKLVESKPVVVNGAEFVVITEEKWISEGNASVWVELRITNKSDKWLVFTLLDTFGISLTDTNGHVVPMGGGRDKMSVPKPALIPPEESHAVTRMAQLQWNGVGNSLTFTYHDGTGATVNCSVEDKAKFKLSFWYEMRSKHAAVCSYYYGFLPVWSGKVVTEQVSYEVIGPR